MEFIQRILEGLEYGVGIVKNGWKYFDEHLWSRYERKLMLLLVITAVLVLCFSGYQINKRGGLNIFGKDNTKEILKKVREQELENLALEKKSNVLQGITEAWIKNSQYSIKGVKNQSPKVSESGEKLQTCANQYFSLKQVVNFYAENANKTIEKLQALKVK